MEPEALTREWVAVVEHIVCFKLKPDATPEQEERLITMLRDLKENVPGIIDLSAGRTFNPDRGQGYTIAVVVRFNDREALAAYGPHPNHQPVKEYASQVCSSVMAIDYEF